MACCLTAPSHYLNQCWLIISKVQRHSSEDNFTIDTSSINHWNYLENYLPKIPFKSPRGQLFKHDGTMHPGLLGTADHLAICISWSYWPSLPLQGFDPKMHGTTMLKFWNNVYKIHAIKYRQSLLYFVLLWTNPETEIGKTSIQIRAWTSRIST